MESKIIKYQKNKFSDKNKILKIVQVNYAFMYAIVIVVNLNDYLSLHSKVHEWKLVLLLTLNKSNM